MIYVDCTLTFQTNGHTGIERMVRGIVKGLDAAGRALNVECAAVVFDPRRGFVMLESEAIERRFGTLGPTGAEAAAGLRSQIKPVLAALNLLAVARVVNTMCRKLWWLMCRALRPFSRGGVSFAPGDVLVLLDVAWDAPYWADLRQARRDGAKIGLCVIDLIMLNHPACVEPQHTAKFQAWFDRVAAAADFFVCISQATWREVCDYHARHPIGDDSRRQLLGGFFRLGADLDRMFGSVAVRPQLRVLFEPPVCDKVYLQVGLISPRKNHDLALDAFEKLWSSGASAALVIVGRAGWSCDAIVERIRTHAEFGTRLFWFEHVGDDELDYCYRHATSLLTTSYAEGFNLPIVEALSRGTTVIATDIPAHREVGGKYAAYFSAHDDAALVALIRQQPADGSLPHVARPADFRWPDWGESCLEFLKTVDELSARHDLPRLLNRLTRATSRSGDLVRRFGKICGEEGLPAAVEKAARSISRLLAGAAATPAVQPAPVCEFLPAGSIPVLHPEPVDFALKQRQTLALHKATREAIAFVAARDLPPSETAPRATAEIAHLLRHFCSGCRHAREACCTLTPSGPPEKPQAPFFRILGDDAGRCPAGRWPGGERPQVTRLNLAYFILPVRHPERVWQWNVAELLKRIGMFNGRRIVTIATVEAGQLLAGMEVDAPAAVMEAFAGHDVEFRLAPNDPEMQEAPHFMAALRELASTDETEALFYAHAKGVTHRNQRPVRAWTSAMYHHNLDRIDEVLDALRRWPCAGIGKHYGLALPFLTGKPTQTWAEAQHPWHGWHFSGTFWWVRHDALFSIRDWDQVELYRYTPEKFLANFFRPEEAYCLSHDDILNPHDPLTWHDLGLTVRAA